MHMQDVQRELIIPCQLHPFSVQSAKQAHIQICRVSTSVLLFHRSCDRSDASGR